MTGAKKTLLDLQIMALTVLWLMTLTFHTISAESLYFSSPGDTTHSGGLYGGRINLTSANSLLDTENLYSNGYNCLYFGQEKQEVLTIESVSFDPISKDVLLSLSEDEERFSLATGSLCSMSDTCQNNTLKILFYKVWKSFEKVGPFAYYNSTVYFLLTKKQELDYRSFRREIQLRELSKCKDQFPVTSSSAFSLEECSKLISTLSSETYESLPSIESMDTLLPMIPPKGTAPAFFTQLEHTNYTANKYYSSLEVVLTYVSSQGHSRAYHRQLVDTEFLNWDLRQLGGISHKDDTICWSAINTILCAKWHSINGLGTPWTVLEKGKADQVCEASIPNQVILAEVITGLAIAEARPTKLSLYFGCAISQGTNTNNVGGAGLLQQLGPESESQVYTLYNNGSAMYAGSMFVREECYNLTSSAWNTGLGVVNKILVMCALVLVIW